MIFIPHMQKKVKAVNSSFDVTTADGKAIDEFPLHIHHFCDMI